MWRTLVPRGYLGRVISLDGLIACIQAMNGDRFATPAPFKKGRLGFFKENRRTDSKNQAALQGELIFGPVILIPVDGLPMA